MKIIVNADDFGWDESCSKAITSAYKQGYLTTTTICSNGNYFDEAVHLAYLFSMEGSVGIHLNLTEGEALTDGIKEIKKFCRDGCFNQNCSRYCRLKDYEKEAIYNELTAQVIKLKKTGIPIHHADSHHHIHNAPNIYPIFMRVIKEQGIKKVRRFRDVGKISLLKRFIKQAYNYNLKQNNLVYSDYFGSYEDFCTLDVENFPATAVLEIMVHPDYNGDMLVDRANDSSYEEPVGDNLLTIYKTLTKQNKLVIAEDIL